MRCPDPESLARLPSAAADDRAAIADHAAACESCRAVLEMLFQPSTPGTDPTVPDYSRSDRAPDRIDRYRVVRRLGAGGMGVVYAAHDPELDRDLAIKMLHRGAAAARLRREAQALARLSHPNVVAVHDVGEHDGQVFVAMALVDGRNLRQWLAEPHPTAEILRALCAAARGIIAAHAAGLIHRDLKPDNIFVATTGDVLVGDFGLARDADDEPATAPGDSTEVDLTQTGTVLGTPAYMAPEQARGAATERSDQFSFCVTAYEALFGTRPFPGKTFSEIQTSIATGRITPPPRGHTVAAGVERALRRGLRADPDERFSSMRELLAEIEPRGRRWPYVALGTGAVAAAIVTTLLVTRGAAAPDIEETCAPTKTAIELVWGPTQHQALASALRQQGHQDGAIADLARRIDQYAAAWATERHAACLAEATQRVTPAQSAGRIACLATRKDNLEVTLASMIAARTGDVFTTWRRITTLPPPAGCSADDVVRLSAGGPAHQALMHDLANVVSTDKAPFADLAARAEAAQDLPAVLEIALSRASEALDVSHVLEADAALERARPLAESLGAQSSRLRAIALSARSLCIQDRPEEAERFLEMAIAGAQRLHEVENQADLDEVFAARDECMFRSGKMRELEPLLLARLDELRRRYGAEGLEEGMLRLRLAQVYATLSRNEDSAHESHEGMRISMRFVSVGKLESVREGALAMDAMQARDLEGALAHERRSVEALMKVDKDDPDLLTELGWLGAFLDMSDRRVEAIEAFTRVIDMIPATTTDEGALNTRADMLDQRGWTELAIGDLERAEADFRASIAGAEHLARPDMVIRAQIGLGRALVATRRFDEAVRVLRPSVAALESPDGGGVARLGAGRFALAQALWETNARSEAVTVGRLAELQLGAMVIYMRPDPLVQKLLPATEAMLAEVVRWRKTHR